MPSGPVKAPLSEGLSSPTTSHSTQHTAHGLSFCLLILYSANFLGAPAACRACPGHSVGHTHTRMHTHTHTHTLCAQEGGLGEATHQYYFYICLF